MLRPTTTWRAQPVGAPAARWQHSAAGVRRGIGKCHSGEPYTVPRVPAVWKRGSG